MMKFWNPPPVFEALVVGTTVDGARKTEAVVAVIQLLTSAAVLAKRTKDADAASPRQANVVARRANQNAAIGILTSGSITMTTSASNGAQVIGQ